MNQEQFNFLVEQKYTQIQYSDIEASTPLLESYGYETKKILGVGAFGAVILAENQKCDEVAIKMVTCKTDKEIVSCFSEASLMRKADSFYIAKMIEFFLEIQSKTVFIVSQFYQGGDLEFYIEKNQNLTEEQIVALFINILRGVQELHNKNIIHSDLKPENILVTKEGIPIISDLGLSTIMKQSSLNASMKGYNDLYSPQEIETEKKVSFKTDYYSLGLILYFLCGQKSISEIYQIKGGNQPDFSKRPFENLLKLSSKMTCHTPEQRTNINEMINLLLEQYPSLSQSNIQQQQQQQSYEKLIHLSQQNELMNIKIKNNQNEINQLKKKVSELLTINNQVLEKDIMIQFQNQQVLKLQQFITEKEEINQSLQIKILQFGKEKQVLRKQAQEQQRTISLLKQNIEKMTSEQKNMENEVQEQEYEQEQLQLSQQQSQDKKYKIINYCISVIIIIINVLTPHFKQAINSDKQSIIISIILLIDIILFEIALVMMIIIIIKQIISFIQRITKILLIFVILNIIILCCR